MNKYDRLYKVILVDGTEYKIEAKDKTIAALRGLTRAINEGKEPNIFGRGIQGTGIKSIRVLSY